MVNELTLDGLTLIEVRQLLYRNIVSLQVSQDLFDDLSDDPSEQQVAAQCEMAVKQSIFTSSCPVIDRPFEDALFRQVIEYPFANPGASRFSTGQWGVWYGCHELSTTIYETGYHWVNGLLRDTQALDNGRQIERKVYTVDCNAALINLSNGLSTHPNVFDPRDYGTSQQFGKLIHDRGLPGVHCPSVRDQQGMNAAIFTPSVLTDAKVCKFLRYEYRDGAVWCDGDPYDVM
ncbi:RES family NAD+ phosphorylase [Salinibius halmophilus]|uniref:RES family NAD+ phosphorylase n=1 Tax=Salinibius halmophilus TaxID=1853216 RepID=UPI000E664B70|nr:RES family NAD+ phosphorylase [Salinibius halmophilus]